MVIDRPYRILSLDGGGSLGVFSLGILTELERKLGPPLHEHFDLLYGTSTGSIIASLLGLGESACRIHKRYMEGIPQIMRRHTARGRTQELQRYADRVFGEKKFDAFLVHVCIVATNLELNRPMVFKSSVELAHGRRSSFVPGFGCTISDAVVASCAAYPMFRAKKLATAPDGGVGLVDGGFSANNPTLFALADALGALRLSRSDLRVLSVGTGSYPERLGLRGRAMAAFRLPKTIMTLLKAGSTAVETVRGLVFDEIETVRVDGEYSNRLYRTSMLEKRTHVLERIFRLGREAFGTHEHELEALFRR